MKNRNNISAWSFNDLCAIKYLEQVTDILAQYSWIYETRNTDIILHNVLEKIPLKWYEELNSLSTTELHQVLFNFIKEKWPSSLKLFIEQCQYLGQFRFPPHNFKELTETTNEPKYVASKVSTKKQYEINVMSGFVNEICQDSNCSVVLDIGSGLGYLDQILHHQYKLKCIGLDSSSQYTLTARERLKKDPCSNSMKHQTLEINSTKECIEDLKNVLEESNFDCNCNVKEKLNQENDSKIMVGLHSCGNLTQDMMKLFCKMEEITAFICVGCCYNKINLNDFPMSKSVQSVVSSTSTRFPGWSPCVSGLRLAAHGTRTHTQDTDKQTHLEKNLFYRALFEKYIQNEKISWRQPKRRIRPSDLPDFETYCKNMLKNHPLEHDSKTLKNLNKLYDDCEHLFPRIRILLVLQTLLQPLWEGFVIVDRMLYFRENDISTQVLALWDDSVSSRNMALCAYKR
ncbi:hypothetical protein JTE90_003786 [Oedothorax gibbosus]|uniref:Methyltransferase domain-containing protein n=1 Tax=Oedothorax gibbosus TaxID=931172 RepID=A0AAV6VBF0_9ARAC|nr:hypothetical protein JTE90_003786 [Oedothorax gibbosus]